MQIVIDIPQGLKIDFENENWTALTCAEMKNALMRGTPLPKGHGRLIDADNAISKICGGSCGCHFEECGYDKPCFSVTRIESAPTIIEADKAESEEDNDT